MDHGAVHCEHHRKWPTLSAILLAHDKRAADHREPANVYGHHHAQWIGERGTLDAHVAANASGAQSGADYDAVSGGGGAYRDMA